MGERVFLVEVLETRRVRYLVAAVDQDHAAQIPEESVQLSDGAVENKTVTHVWLETDIDELPDEYLED